MQLLLGPQHLEAETLQLAHSFRGMQAAEAGARTANPPPPCTACSVHRLLHRRQDRGLHGGGQAAAQGGRRGQGAHLPGARHAKGGLGGREGGLARASRHGRQRVQGWASAPRGPCQRCLHATMPAPPAPQPAPCPAAAQVWGDVYTLPVPGCDGKTAAEIFEAAGCVTPAAPSCAACLGGPRDTFARMNEPEVCVSTTNRCVPGSWRGGGIGGDVGARGRAGSS